MFPTDILNIVSEYVHPNDKITTIHYYVLAHKPYNSIGDKFVLIGDILISGKKNIEMHQNKKSGDCNLACIDYPQVMYSLYDIQTGFSDFKSYTGYINQIETSHIRKKLFLSDRSDINVSHFTTKSNFAHYTDPLFNNKHTQDRTAYVKTLNAKLYSNLLHECL